MSKKAKSRDEVKVGGTVVAVYKTPTASSSECHTLVHYEGRRRVRQTCVGRTEALAQPQTLHIEIAEQVLGWFSWRGDVKRVVPTKR